MIFMNWMNFLFKRFDDPTPRTTEIGLFTIMILQKNSRSERIKDSSALASS